VSQTIAMTSQATLSVQLNSNSGIPQHIPIGLYWLNYEINQTIKSNNQIKTTNEHIICEKKYKTRT